MTKPGAVRDPTPLNRVEHLTDWGVDTVFGLPGDRITGIMEGLNRHQDRVRFGLAGFGVSLAVCAVVLR